MSNTSRPTSRWSTSVLSTTKSNSSVNKTTPLIISRRKLFRTSTNNQPTFSQRMAKTRHDIEELFKLYYSNNIKFDTFQRQIVTGTRIPSGQTSTIIQNPLTNSSTNVFNSKHCVSREQINSLDIIDNELKQIPIKRTVQVRIDNNPTIVQSTNSLSTTLPSLLPPVSTNDTMNSNSNLIVPENSFLNRQDELNELSLVKSFACLGDMSVDSLENNYTKKNKSIHGQRSTSSKSSLASLPSAIPSSLSLINNRKELINISHSSLSTANSIQQQQNQPHIVTGTAVTVRERSLGKQAWHKQRIKSTTPISTNSSSQQPLIKTSPLSIHSDTSDSSIPIGAQRTVSIPSKCSRYVLVTFPRVPIRYHTPTYVERLLLPERFPSLFQNIIHSCEHNRNNK